jgi:hypothetical protein
MSSTMLIGVHVRTRGQHFTMERPPPSRVRAMASANRRRSGKTSTHGGLTHGHLKLHSDLHHLDGRDLGRIRRVDADAGKAFSATGVAANPEQPIRAATGPVELRGPRER